MLLNPSSPQSLSHGVWVPLDNLGKSLVHFQQSLVNCEIASTMSCSLWDCLKKEFCLRTSTSMKSLQVEQTKRHCSTCPIVLICFSEMMRSEDRYWRWSPTCGRGRCAKTLERNSVKPQPMSKSIDKLGLGLISSILASLKNPPWGDRLLFPNLFNTGNRSEKSLTSSSRSFPVVFRWLLQAASIHGPFWSLNLEIAKRSILKRF